MLILREGINDKEYALLEKDGLSINIISMNDKMFFFQNMLPNLQIKINDLKKIFPDR